MNSREEVNTFLSRSDVGYEIPKLTKEQIKWVLDELGVPYRVSDKKSKLVTLAMGAIAVNQTGLEVDDVESGDDDDSRDESSLPASKEKTPVDASRDRESILDDTIIDLEKEFRLLEETCVAKGRVTEAEVQMLKLKIEYMRERKRERKRER